MYILTVVFLLLPFVLTAGDASATITGTVTDSKTGAAIPNVNVILKGTRIGAATDSNGRFHIGDLPGGVYTLEFSHINYVPTTYTQDFRAGVSYELNIELHSRPIRLDEVEVVEEPRGRFMPGRGTGYVIGGEEIRRSGVTTFAGVIRTFVPRARVEEYGGNLYIQLQLRTTIAQRYDRGDPFPLIILNDMPMGTSPIGLANLVSPSDIEYMYVVRPPESESLYGTEARHGAIIIETVALTEEDIHMSKTLRRLVAGGLAGLLIFLAFFQ